MSNESITLIGGPYAGEIFSKSELGGRTHLAVNRPGGIHADYYWCDLNRNFVYDAPGMPVAAEHSIGAGTPNFGRAPQCAPDYPGYAGEQLHRKAS